jgi:prepilin-type N-terminal cleavage/methylation domain-containing protein
MNTQRGFTVIELIIVTTLALIAGSVFYWQKNELSVSARDSQQKTAINAMYYGLEEVYYKQKGSYPKTISSENLTSIDPALFKAPNGKKLGEEGSTYRYEALNCDQDTCKSYVLRADLEKESDFVKNSRH